MARSGHALGDVTKRLVDLAIAVPLGVVLLPVAGAVALVVRLGIGTPVLFRHRRAGRGGTPFVVRKFRTMTDEVDANGEPLPDDERLTPIGRRLRRTSLDELPQLWSVIRGEMSLVGPRPLPVEYVERYDSRQRRRLEVLPGLTGWAQVNGRNALDWPRRLELDVWYVDHRSLRLDLSILVRSVRVVLRGEGVSADGHATMEEFMGTGDDSTVTPS